MIANTEPTIRVTGQTITTDGQLTEPTVVDNCLVKEIYVRYNRVGITAIYLGGDIIKKNGEVGNKHIRLSYGRDGEGAPAWARTFARNNRP